MIRSVAIVSFRHRIATLVLVSSVPSNGRPEGGVFACIVVHEGGVFGCIKGICTCVSARRMGVCTDVYEAVQTYVSWLKIRL